MRKWLSQEEKQNIGTVCCNCGATEDIEYHHIVPLLLGGNDVKSNIVPLCYKTWKDSKSQIGAYKSLENAKKACKAGYTVFDWNGKVVYSMTAKKSVAQVAKEVINGEWGNGQDRRDRLESAGYNYAEVQKKVNELLK